VKLNRKIALAGLTFAVLISGGGFFAYQKYEAHRHQEDLKALARECDRCAERKAAGLRFREWLATQRKQESANSSQ
jgi:glutathione S-transferase